MTQPTTSIWRGLLQLFHYVSSRRRWQGLLVLALMVVGAVAELMTIGSVLPFLAFITDPEAASQYAAVRKMLVILDLRNHESAVTAFAVIFCLIALAAGAIRILLAWASQKFIFRVGFDLGVALYSSVLFQPYSFHVAHNSSQILAGINKVQQVLNGMMLPLMQGLTSLIIAIFILAGLLLVDARVALLSTASFGLIYFAVSLATRRRLRANSQIIAQSGTLKMKTVQEGLGGIRDVLIDRSQAVYIKKFSRIDERLRDAQATNALISVAPRFVIESIGMVLIAVLSLFLVKGEGGLTAALPVLGALALGAQRLLPLLQQTYNGWAQIMNNRSTFFDVLALLDQPGAKGPQSIHLLPSAPLGHVIPFNRDIRFEQVCFRYAASSPYAVDHVDLHIPKGARVGFMGKTGSGKSTMLDLIMGLLEPSAGAIRIDGEQLTKCNVAAWQNRVAHVPQAIYLSDGPIVENIAFGVDRAKIDMKQVYEAARKADIHNYIGGQTKGYDTLVGERGVRLSGGQRQRIGIARALYKQASVLVLDEATSALDDETEASVIEAVEGLGNDLTIIMIAHRLTTLRNCDIIYHIEGGRVVQRGRYSQLIEGESQRKPVCG
ncbi:MAG: ABC transporter ATP-binding protein [Sphingobium sp.]|uniref:ABC transporter ATP-binding protein n=1 Tax=Sphingobium sp. TaxID=1912891 RepID=UPI0029A25C38|nr:ABC transporter ATP-binding protein [Sphingobium sp.]MDX3911642.1 ABC transporter ATP-binding protein [Sphingobium sp.]